MRAVATLILLISAVVSVARADEKRLPQPEAAAIAKARKEILELFSKDIEKTKTPAARKELATRLLTAANDAKESPVNRWALYNQSLELAAASGDVQFTVDVLQDFGKAFSVKRSELAAEVANKLAKSVLTMAYQALIDYTIAEADAATHLDEYDNAVKLLAVGSRIAQLRRDFPQVRQIEARLKQVTEWGKVFDDVKGIDEHMGKFQCFRKGNWEKGLPLLINSADANLAAVAKADLGNPKEAKDQALLGNSWFEMAEKEKGEVRSNMLQRSYHWHTQAVGTLSGLEKLKVEQTMKKIAGEVGSVLSPGQALFNGKVSFDVKTKRLSITYDFSDARQLDDFKLGGAKPTRPVTVGKALKLAAQSQITHVAHFQTATITGRLTYCQLRGQ